MPKRISLEFAREPTVSYCKPSFNLKILLGQPDYTHLAAALSAWSKTGLPLIGCFSAASNVTGCLTDTIKISQLMHQYQGIALFDYATAAPYVKIDMHPPEEGASKVKMLSFRFFTAYFQDGIFFSPHKFPGGCNTPGVLIASKKLFQNKVPHGGGGGGTIFWVSESNHRFLADAEEREEPGTPDLIGSGMVIIFYKS